MRRGLIVVVGAGLLAATGTVHASESAYRRPLILGGAIDSYPYSYLDDSGKLSGFGVELLDAVARRMNLELKREPIPAMEDLRRFAAGEFDLGQLHPHLPGHDDDAEYSVPVLVLQGVMFVREGDHRFETLADLKARRARVVAPPQGYAFALAQGLDPVLLREASAPECLRLLSTSEVDAALLTRLTGMAQAQHLGIRHVVPVGPSLEGFVVRYCFVTHKGNTALINQLNEGLAILFRTGEYETIYQKWFAKYEPPRFTRGEVVIYIMAALSVALVIALWALVHQRTLRRRIARQAEELAEGRGILAEAQRFARLGHWRRYFDESTRGVWSDETYRIMEHDPKLGVPDLDDLTSCAVGPDRTRWREAIQRLKSSGEPYDLDIVVEPRPGVRKTIHMRSRAVLDAAGRVTGSFGTVQDVTAWRTAEEALRQSERLLRALYQNLPFALGVFERVGEEWRVVSLNPEALRHLGLAAEPEPGQSLASLGFPPEWLQYWVGLFARCVNSSETFKVDMLRKERSRDYAITLVPLGGSGDRARCCFLGEDVTERKHREAEISQGRRLRAIGELVGGIAHEFNNLLTPILLNSDLLQTQWSHLPGLRDELKVIADAARRSAELTRRLLAFGRKTDNKPELITLSSVVEANIQLVRHTFDRRIRLKYVMPAGLPPLFLNPPDLHQILLNLLVNARDTLSDKLAQSPPADWIACIQIDAALRPADSITPFEPSVAPPLSWIRLTVRDNGGGMPPSVLERVFEPFYTTKQVGKGTGLGLATVWHLVTEFGGRVDVESTMGEGSAFHVYLPVRQVPATAATPRAVTPVERIASRRVLLIEDEEAISLLISTLLRRDGHEVVLATDGLEGWSRLSATPGDFDAVIMDLNMPGLSGLEVARRARAIPYQRPMVVMSGRVTDADLERLKQLDIARVLYKPFTADVLRSALRAIFPPAGS